MNYTPVEIRLRTDSRLITISFMDGKNFDLSFEYLRVNSPSAEVTGHSQGQAILQTGKKDIQINKIDPIGHYAIKLHFDDGHNSGIYTWNYLYKLGKNQSSIWQNYLDRLKKEGYAR